MHLRRSVSRFWVIAGLFAAFAAGAAVIYKWTDADGVVHYSDQSTPGAERIVTSSGTSNGIGGAARGAAQASAAPKSAASGLNYSKFMIASPAPDQVFFNDEIIPVRLVLEPSLQPNQSITWHLNGKQLDDQAPDAVSFALQGLPRGVYAIAATITDLVSGDSQSTDSVTFNMRQPSELSPQHKTP